MKTTTTMADIDTNEIRKAIAEILEGADLSTLSAKKIRRHLEDKFDEDLTERKEEIDELLMNMIAEKNDSQNSEDDESESESEEEVKAPPKKKAKASPKKTVSKTANRSSSKPKSKKTVDSSDELSDEERNGDDLDDEELARKLQAEESRTRHRSAKKTPSKKKDPNKTPRKRSGQSAYSRPCDLTPELAEVLGTDKMARKDIVKNMWAIVKERNLQDPANKQFMLCDDQLLKIFGKKRIKTFGMMKYLKNHIL